MFKKILFSTLCIALTVGVNAQEVQTDTIRTNLQQEVIEALGDSGDLVVAPHGTSNWFLSASVGVRFYAICFFNF